MSGRPGAAYVVPLPLSLGLEAAFPHPAGDRRAEPRFADAEGVAAIGHRREISATYRVTGVAVDAPGP